MRQSNAQIRTQVCKSQSCQLASFNAMSSSSSSSSSAPRWEYEVFLSFRGEDTRNNFTDYLHRALVEKHIKVFKDDEKLKHGEEISQELLKAIEESQIAVLIISKNFATSKWCLGELAKIMECKRQKQMEVWPIFYHVDPSHVRNLKKTFAQAFDQHANDPMVDKQQMETWRAALKEVGHLKGSHVHNNRPEAEEVKELSEELSCKLNPNFSKLYKDFVGMETRVEELKNLLCIGHDDVRCVGIYGMNGIGKTTLAKLIYERTSLEFKSSCFLGEDEQDWKYGGVKVIDKRFISEKVLIVIDDVDEKKQLEAFTKLEVALRDGNRDWFGPGSRIIITSSDYQLISQLIDCKFGDHAFKVKKLDDGEALELFSLKAFKKHFPKDGYLELSEDIVRYAEGLPLAIEVFGSFFFGKSIDAWKSSQKMLEEDLEARILDKLKISFDGLRDKQQQLFLDIACFFNGQPLDWLIPILESFGYLPKINIEVLREKSLIKIKDEKIWMHNLLVQMGKQIVKVEYKNRLWNYEDIIDVLKNDTSIDAIEGIRLLLHNGDVEELNLEAFSKMHQLRMIEITPKDSYFEDYFLEVTLKNSYPKNIFSWTKEWSIDHFKFLQKDSYPLEFMPKGLEECLGKLQWAGDYSKFKLSDKLCLLNWFQYPLHSLPSTFQPKNLIELKLPCSHVKILWSESKSFEKLRVIHLNFSINLKEIPNLKNVPNLEKLEASYCTSLFKVHPSIGSLKQLNLLDLRGCKKLKNLPEDLGGMESLEELNISQTSIKQLPSSVGSLKKLKVFKGGGTFSNSVSFRLPKSISSLSSLECLNLQYCSLSDGIIPNDLGNLSSLKRLFLDGNKLKRVPEFVWKLSKLEDLGLSYCNLPDGGILDDITRLSLLKELRLEGNIFKAIPDSISQLPNLYSLSLSDNTNLMALPKLPCALQFLYRSNCPLLNSSSVEKWGLGLQILKSPFGVIYYEYDGKSHKILYMDSEYTYTMVYVDVACGPTLESEIHEWFEMRSNGPSEIQGQMRGGKIWDLWGLALFIVYEVHENPDCNGFDDSNPTVFEIAYRMRSEITFFDRHVVEDPASGQTSFECRVVEVPPFRRTGFECRRNGLWVFLSNHAFSECFASCCYSLVESIDITLSVSANNPNIDVKEYGVRGVGPDDEGDWCQVLGDISFHGWAPENFEDFHSCSFQYCHYR